MINVNKLAAVLACLSLLTASVAAHAGSDNKDSKSGTSAAPVKVEVKKEEKKVEVAKVEPVKEEKKEEKKDDKKDEKDHHKDKTSWFKEAYELAAKEDKANASQKYDMAFEIAFVTRAAGGDAITATPKGIPELMTSMSVNGENVSPVVNLSGTDDSISQLKKGFGFSFYSKEKNLVGSQLVGKCEEVAKMAAAQKMKMRVRATGIPRHDVIVTQRELILQFGEAFFKSRLGINANKITFGDFKKFVADLNGKVVIRNYTSFLHSNQNVSCELAK